MKDLTAQLEQLADLLRQTRPVVVLTGAGLSTPSGIPDFRSPGTGLWEHVHPLEVASLATFRYYPERFFAALRPLAVRILHAQPNPAHYALAALEKAYFVRGLITQNVDGLHHQAGSHQVVELHGTLRTATCGSCHQRYTSADFLHPFLTTGHAPHCLTCGCYVKPDVILMGEQLPRAALVAAQHAMRDCQLLIVAGSSLEVAPAASLPHEALLHGARLVLINHDPTHLDARAELVIRADVAQVFPRLVELLGLPPHDAPR